MKRKDIVIGIVLLLLLGGVLYLRNRNKPQEETKVPETLSSQQMFEEKFNIKIPEDVDKAELKQVGSLTGSGLATRGSENGAFTYSILADLPDPQAGYFYEGWLIKGQEGEEGYAIISTGKMRLAKGGWILDYKLTSDLNDYSKVVVSLEKVNDNKIEDKVLEGSF